MNKRAFMRTMTAQNGVCVCILIYSGPVLMLMGLSRQIQASVQEFTNEVHCKIWDASLSKCQECHSGFFGINCTSKCRYPSYGSACQNACNCNETFCIPSTGCEDGSPTLLPKLTSNITKKTSVTRMMTVKTVAACSVGFFGSSCDIPCRFPSYGFHCQSKCSCREDNCNHVVGCSESSTFCNSEEGDKLQAMKYGTVVLSVWAILQISVYLYFSLHFSSTIQFTINNT